jgi:HflK protein
MTRFPERAALVALLLSAVAALVDGLLVGRTDLLVLRALIPFHFWCIALALLAAMRCRLARLSAEERRDEATARAEQSGAALFADSAASDALGIARTFDQFERIVLPAAAPVLAAALGFWCWRLLDGLPQFLVSPSQRLLDASFLGGQSFLLFLLGRYIVGLARETDHRALRGPGLAIGATAAASAAGMAAAFTAEFAWPSADRYVAVALLVFLGFIAMETALRFLLAVYSPRRSSALATATESRVAAAIADPGSWTRDLAQAVDYQFGFKVSETWFFRFLERALLPLVAIQLCVLYLMSSLVFLGPDEEGVLEHFGKPIAGQWQLDSGFHLKWPWPFETVRRFPSRRVLSVPVGYTPGTNAAPRVIVWTIPHFGTEDLFTTASRAEAGSGPGASVPVNLVTVNMPVEYRVTNLYAYTYDFTEPATVLRHAAYRALTRELARRDLAELLTENRLAIGHELAAAIQADADQLGLGVEITFVGLQGIHPPVPVAEAFESVIGASEEREARILEARAYTNRVLPVAAAHAVERRREAEAYRARRDQIARAEAGQFVQRLAAYRQSPAVFKSRMYLASLRDALSNTRKYIVDAPASQEVITFNMEEEPFSGLIDMGLAPVEDEETR